MDVDLNDDTIMYEQGGLPDSSSGGRESEFEPTGTLSDHKHSNGSQSGGGDVALGASKSVEISAQSQRSDDSSSTSLLQEFLLVNFDVNNVKVTEVIRAPRLHFLSRALIFYF